MAKVFIEESTLTEIGNAIRSKKSSSAKIPVPSMASEILSIEAGTASLKLIINIESGSAVTCSNPATGVSYSTTSVNGEAVFNGVSLGTWNLTATKNGKTATKTIEITNPEFTMVYETLLYSNGNGYTEVTGGWTSIASVGGSPGVTNRVNNEITWAQISNSGSGVYITTNPIDITLFDTIEFQGNWNANGIGKIIAISDDFTAWNDWNDYAVLSVPIEELDWDNTNTDPTVDPIQTVDISGLSGSYRIGFGMSGSGSTSIIRMASLKLKYNKPRRLNTYGVIFIHSSYTFHKCSLRERGQGGIFQVCHDAARQCLAKFPLQ